MYYLNAFNEMLRKRQRQNMMGGEGYQGGGNAPPSGPMGLGPAQDRSGLRDFYNSLSPTASLALGMAPVIGPAFNLGKLANYGISAYDKSQLAPADAAMASARQGFQASEKGLYDAPEYGPAPVGNFFQIAYEAGMVTNSFPAERMGGTAPGYVDDSNDRLSFSGPTVGGPISTPNLNFTAFTGASYSTPSAAEQQARNFGGESVGFGGGFGGGVGTGEFGGSPESASDLGYNQGGMVTPDRLMGRAPAPDDGYGALQGGEYVITKAAVEKYGKRLLDAINNGTFR
jgi:hypothetical protein